VGVVGPHGGLADVAAQGRRGGGLGGHGLHPADGAVDLRELLGRRLDIDL
jgi:hypothetical protein